MPISGRLTVLQRAIDAAQNLTGLALTRAEGARSRVGRTEAALAVRVAVTSWGAASREGADVAGVEGALKALAGALDRNADVPEALATAQAVVAQLTQRQGEMQAEKLELDGMIRILSVNS